MPILVPVKLPIPVAIAKKAKSDPYNEDYVLPNATSGTKTDTPIMETPLNVQVISKQVMKDQQVITLSDSLKNVSGITTANGGLSGGTDGGIEQTIFLRGFASDTYFRDGFRLQQGAGQREMANVENVEVLKGPAAILYGLVEPGGMVNVVTKKPQETPYYAMSQQFGSHNLYRTTVDATGPIADNKAILYRMNMSYQNSGSFRDFVGKEDVFLAPVLKWNFSPRTQVTFELEYNYQHLGLDAGFVPLLNNQLINMPIKRNYSGYSPGTTETVYGGFNWSHQFDDDWTIKHKFSVNQKQDVTNVLWPLLADAVNVSRIYYAQKNQYNTYSTNFDLTGHFDTFWLKHTLLLGGDYYNINTVTNSGYALNAVTFYDLSTINTFNPVQPGTPFTQSVTPNINSVSNVVDQYGLYIQDQIKLPYNVQVMGGIRYQNLHQAQTSQPLGASSQLTALSQDAVTPRVGILWKAQNWLSLYANYAESFGANTGIVYPNKPIPPSNAEQYEGGIKTEFFDGRLRSTLAYFDLTKTNIATCDTIHSNSCSFSFATGAVRSRGPELDIQGEILPGWNAILTYANLDARTTIGDPTQVGQRPYNVPRNTGSFWSTYDLQDPDLKGLKIGGGVTVRDGQSACCDTPRFISPGYATVDLLAGYAVKLGQTKVTTQLNINNLLNKHYYTGISTSSSLGEGFVDFGAPRTVLGSIRVEY